MSSSRKIASKVVPRGMLQENRNLLSGVRCAKIFRVAD
jgi:hypothetical protein